MRPREKVGVVHRCVPALLLELAQESENYPLLLAAQVEREGAQKIEGWCEIQERVQGGVRLDFPADLFISGKFLLRRLVLKGKPADATLRFTSITVS